MNAAMMTDSATARSPEPTLEIDLLLYLSALIDNWKLIVISAVVSACLVAGYCLTLPDVFEAFARTAIVDSEDPGGIKPDERRASEVLTLVEHGFIMGTSRDNHLEVTLARLRSRAFTMEFMESQNIYTRLYPEFWDADNQRWADGFEPDRIAAFKQFSEQIRLLEHNAENDIITVRMRWTDPALARYWANSYISEFNRHIRNRTLAEVDRKQAFLHAELEKSSVVDIQKSIYRLIEAQTAIAMLANSREEFAIEVIDPATVPFDRFSPAPKRLTLFGFVAGAMLACFFVIARVLYARAMTFIDLLRHTHAD